MKKVAAILIVILSMLAAAFAYRYYSTVYLPEKEIDTADKEQRELIDRIRPEVAHGEASSDNSSSAAKGGTAESPLKNVKELNGDAVGWIYIPDTAIDYPVMQYSDNDFYLHNGADGAYNGELGCPFLDYRCEYDFSGFNSIVYGHNIEGERMFANISLFDDESYFNSHSTGVLTLDDGAHNVDFIAYLNVSSTSPVYHAVFMTPSDRSDYIDYLFTFAKHKDDTDLKALKENDDLHLLVLSTCTFEFDEARGVLVGIIE